MKKKNLMLVFAVAFAFCTTAMACDIAFYVGAPNTEGWYDVATMNTNVATIIAQTGALFKDIQKFDDKQLVEFGAWVEANTNDGEMDIIWLNGCVPSVLYGIGNTQPDGSRIEAWLDGGNMVINVGDWFGYVSFEGGTRQTNNGSTGAANILDLASGIIVSADGTTLPVTATGKQYLPSLNDPAPSDRPVVLAQVRAPWEVAAIFAQDAAGTRADPVVLHNTVTDGYLAIINQGGTGHWITDRGLTTAEFINNWVRALIVGNPFARRPDPKDGALIAQTWLSMAWLPGDFAVSHDMYLGESFEDVNAGIGNTFRGNLPSTLFLVGLGMPGDPYPAGLVPGTTYYWRIDEVNAADPNSPWKGPVWSFWIRPQKAYEPSPADGAKYQDLAPTLSWTPGLNAKLHYVYFGDNFEDVNKATAGAPRGTATYTPAGPLAKGKTYYWRIDEFDAAATHKGDVWSFTTLGEIPITDPNLVGWWKFEAGTGTRVIDWSGHANHGTIVPGSLGTVQLAEGLFNMALEFLGDDWGQVDLPPRIVTPVKGSVLMWINTTQGNAANNDEGMLWYATAASGNGYTNTDNEMHLNIDDPGEGVLDFFLGGVSGVTIDGPRVGGTGWTHVAATWDLTDGLRMYVNGVQVGSAAHTGLNTNLAIIRLGRPVTTGDGNRYYDGLMDDVRLFNHALSAAQVNQIISKGEDPLQAGTPKPSNGALVAINLATPLSWTPGDKASQHDVYFGTDQAAVANADASDTMGVYRGRQSATSYAPPEIAWNGGPYYWRTDEVSNDGTITQGKVWSFSVADYLLVEDFESYDVGNNEIWWSWRDGLGYVAHGTVPAYPGNGTGAAVGDDRTSTYAERTIVHGGQQSIPFWYDNNKQGKSKYSEAELTLATTRNWTIEGVTALSLWYHAEPGNAPERMYVAISNRTGAAAVVYNTAIQPTTIDVWRRWNVPLQAFADQGINLADVDRIAVGFGTKGNTTIPGGAGKMYIDDIRLYRAVPAPPEEIVLEAEAVNSITAPLTVRSDALASGGQCIGTDAGIGDESTNPPATGVATYSITVQGGVYRLVGRVIIPSGDSFWLRIPDATTQTTNHPASGWVRWSDPANGDTWHWENVFSGDDAGQTVQFTLAAGTHTLEIARREDGALLDAILITTDIE